MKRSYLFEVFVSYAHEDLEVALKVAEFLKSHGLSVWFDRWRLKAGDDYERKIIDGLNASKQAIVCLSKHYSSWTLIESSHFLTRGKSAAKRNLIPIKCDEVDLPPICNRLQCIDWNVQSDPLNHLLDVLRESADHSARKIKYCSQHLDLRTSTGFIKTKLAGLDRLTARGTQLPIVLLGGVYMDFHLRPITTTVLTGDEYPHMQPISTGLGGSAIEVGQHLKMAYGKTSHLHSVISGIDADLLANQCRELLLKEDWIINPELIRKGTLPPATTVILHQGTHTFNTMFTHAGVLAELTWDMIGDSVRHSLDSGGVLYISAFFKSKLWVRLHENLKSFSSSLVIIDHGRLMPGLHNQNAITTLAGAFQRKLIDVYICTSRELWDLVSFIDGVQWEPQDDTINALEAIARRNILPYITYVRSRKVHPDTQAESYEAYCIAGKDVIQLRPAPSLGNSFIPVRPGAVVKNIFNAAVLHSISMGSSEGSVKARFISAGQSALQQCQSLT